MQAAVFACRTVHNRPETLIHFLLSMNFNESLSHDEVAERLRHWTANPMCSTRVGSNPIHVDEFFIRVLVADGRNSVMSFHTDV